MTRFDEMLRRGLMDANLAQYETVLQRADSLETDFSPRYLRERTRLLADPWGWVRRRSGRKRLDWRLIAIAAALLLLSACAYAVVTGQFSQWFPRVGVDPAAPEISEDIMARTGTVIGQTRTAGSETATLNAAVWDGDYVRFSLVVKSPDLPEELTTDSRIYAEECWFTMPEESWKEYVRRDEMSWCEEEGIDPPDWMEESIQNLLDLGQKDYWNHLAQLNFNLIDRTEDTLTFEVSMSLSSIMELPELTLHVENIAIYEDSGEPITWHDGIRTGPGPETPVLSGPFDFTFTLEKPILPIHYAGDVEVTVEDIPLRFTGFEISVFDMDSDYEVLVPVNPVHVSRPDEPEPVTDPNLLNDQDVTAVTRQMLRGLWTADGVYVDFENCAGSQALTTDPKDNSAKGSVGRSYPYVVDPETVTAVNVGGVRVELGELERLAE